jgi:hypothetical protein
MTTDSGSKLYFMQLLTFVVFHYDFFIETRSFRALESTVFLSSNFVVSVTTKILVNMHGKNTLIAFFISFLKYFQCDHQGRGQSRLALLRQLHQNSAAPCGSVILVKTTTFFALFQLKEPEFAGDECKPVLSVVFDVEVGIYKQ